MIKVLVRPSAARSDANRLFLHQFEAAAARELGWARPIRTACGAPYAVCGDREHRHLRAVRDGAVAHFRSATPDQKIRGEGILRTIFLYPFALSFIVVGLAWQWILNPDLGIQSVVRGLGWESFAFDPLFNQNIVIFGIIAAGLWQGTGLNMVVMLAGLRGIDGEIWKATRIDGIPAWKVYIRIVLPMMKPAIATAVVMTGVNIVKMYDLVVAMTNGGPGGSSEVPAKYVIDAMFTSQNLGQAFAASTVMLIAVVIILIPWFYMQRAERRNAHH
ncbi:MAG: sugar ABC transporter permease [Paracoccaceae bacterium]